MAQRAPQTRRMTEVDPPEAPAVHRTGRDPLGMPLDDVHNAGHRGADRLALRDGKRRLQDVDGRGEVPRTVAPHHRRPPAVDRAQLDCTAQQEIRHRVRVEEVHRALWRRQAQTLLVSAETPAEREAQG